MGPKSGVEPNSISRFHGSAAPRSVFSKIKPVCFGHYLDIPTRPAIPTVIVESKPKRGVKVGGEAAGAPKRRKVGPEIRLILARSRRIPVIARLGQPRFVGHRNRLCRFFLF